MHYVIYGVDSRDVQEQRFGAYNHPSVAKAPSPSWCSISRILTAPFTIIKHYIKRKHMWWRQERFFTLFLLWSKLASLTTLWKRAKQSLLHFALRITQYWCSSRTKWDAQIRYISYLTRVSQNPSVSEEVRPVDEEQPLYFASLNAIPSSERRLVSYVVFGGLTSYWNMVLASNGHVDHIHGFPKVAAKRGDPGVWMVSLMPLFDRFYLEFFRKGYRANNA